MGEDVRGFEKFVLRVSTIFNTVAACLLFLFSQLEVQSPQKLIIKLEVLLQITLQKILLR